MAKPALGKGMKDLLGKKIGIARMGPSKDKDSVKEELKINIERYQAQGFDVTLRDNPYHVGFVAKIDIVI